MRENQQRRLPLVNEIAGALVAGECARDAELDKDFVADPKGALSRTGFSSAADVTLRLVRNTAREVNLAIPAYPGIDAATAKVALSDDDMRRVVGGEVFGAIAVAIGIATVTAITVGGVTAVAIKVDKKRKKGKR